MRTRCLARGPLANLAIRDFADGLVATTITLVSMTTTVQASWATDARRFKRRALRDRHSGQQQLWTLVAAAFHEAEREVELARWTMAVCDCLTEEGHPISLEFLRLYRRSGSGTSRWNGGGIWCVSRTRKPVCGRVSRCSSSATGARAWSKRAARRRADGLTTPRTNDGESR